MQVKVKILFSLFIHTALLAQDIFARVNLKMEAYPKYIGIIITALIVEQN